MAAPKPPKARQAVGALTDRDLDRQLRRAHKEVALAEARYTSGLLEQLQQSEQRLNEAQFVLPEPDEGSWATIGGASNQKVLTESRDPMTLRRQMYRLWRFNPHARGILRNFVRFIMGTKFGVDFEEQRVGKWNEDQTKIQVTTSEDDLPIGRLLWDDFVLRNRFMQRAKELVLRTFRDGECFLRKFERKGRISLRFIEPEHVHNPGGSPGSFGQVARGTVEAGDLPGDEYVGEETVIQDGVEYLHDDRETVVAYHFTPRTPGLATPMAHKSERIPAAQMIHAKAFCDMNDLRGVPMLEVVARQLANYAQWEEYRMILNKMRSAVALVRKVEGTSSQAQAIIQGRLPARENPRRLEPQTTSGNREAMFRPGTTLTPSAGVSYDFIAPNLQARDAGEDGRRFLLTVAAGTGLPEMLITGDWSNSNFASSVEARTPSVREWEDWQEFFGEHFLTMIRWIFEAAIEANMVPKDTDPDAVIQWPAVIAKDVFRDTERYMNLWSSGILSKRTWAALEDLDYDAEKENMREDAEDDLQHGPLQPAPQAGFQRLPQNPSERQAKGQYGPEGQPREPDAQNRDQRNPAGNERPRQEAFAEYERSLATLREDLDDLADPALTAAVDRYIESATQVLVLGGRGNGHHRNGHTTAHRRRLPRSRR